MGDGRRCPHDTTRVRHDRRSSTPRAGSLAHTVGRAVARPSPGSISPSEPGPRPRPPPHRSDRTCAERSAGGAVTTLTCVIPEASRRVLL